MEVLLWLLFGGLAFMCLVLFNRNISLSRDKKNLEAGLEMSFSEYHSSELEISRLQGQLEASKPSMVDYTDLIPKSIHDALLSEKAHLLTEATQEAVNLKTKYENERGKAISERVRLGHVSENFAAFLDKFPYDRSKVRALFQPIDLIYFGDDEIVIIDVKSGDSKLSDKQRNIKKLVEAGKVRFETHQINEDGYVIK